jgi:hypothetical protein
MVRKRDALIAAWAIALTAVCSSAGGCGGSSSSTFDPNAGSNSSDGGGGGGSPSGNSGSGSSSSGSGSGAGLFQSGPDATTGANGCTGLGCLVPANCTTSISGTVYDPAGANPLYDVVVFVPNDPAGSLPAIKVGTNTCSSCDVSIGNYVAATTSDADGHFTLKGVPATTKVPLVVQIGKWRREVFLPEVKGCTDNVLSGSASTRLPKNQQEGNIPQMALVTGSADNLGCFLEGIGLDPAEYSAPHGGGRLDIYQGLSRGGGRAGGGGGRGGAPGLSTGGTAGDCSTDNPNCVWNSKTNLEAYDIVLLACEGNPYDPDDPDTNTPTNKTATSKGALRDWLNEGGKAFATHFQYTWFKNSPGADFRNVATWLGASNGDQMGNYDIDTTFPKGQVFAQWLANVKALTGTQIALSQVADSVSTVNTPTQRWIYEASSSDTKYFSFVTPLGGLAPSPDAGSEAQPQYCGKAVFSDLHAGGSPAGSIPASCSGPPLTPQLKALEFLFFDLSACVSNDGQPPPPPPQPTK